MEGGVIITFRANLVRSFFKVLLPVLLFTGLSRASEDWQKFPIGPFSGVNNRDSSFAIPAQNAQDLLNIELTPGGKSVKKRHGYGTAFTLNQTTSPVHGVYDFFDSNGNEVNLFFSDTKVYGSVSGAAATVLLSTGPLNATWQCTDSLGQAYCVNSSRTGLYKISGSTLSQIMTVVSTGTMITTAVTRLAMAGFSDAPSRIDFSADGDFTTWGTGSAASSAVQVTVNAPGARITHITYAFGRLMDFKDTSFGYVLIGNQPLQTDWVVKTVAYDVGTNDNTSVYREGLLYFRGKDGHIYVFDGNTYQRLSREISGTIALAQTRASNSWTQSSQSDWQTGVSSADLSLTLVAGSILSKTTSYVYGNSQLTWSSGTMTSAVFADTITLPGSLQTTWPDEFTALRTTTTASQKPVWVVGQIGQSSVAVVGGELNMSCSATSNNPLIRSFDQLPNFITGTTYFVRIDSTPGTAFGLALTTTSVSTITFTGATFQAQIGSGIGFCTGGKIALDQVLSFHSSGTFDNIGVPSPPVCFSAPQDIFLYIDTGTFQVMIGTTVVQRSNHNWNPSPVYARLFTSGTSVTHKFDRFGVVPETFTYTSGGMDTGIVAPKWSTFTIVSTGDGVFSGTSSVSADNVTYDSSVSLSSGSTPTSGAKEYVKVATAFNMNVASGAALSISNYNVLAGSSGTFLSAVNNAPNITSWDSFNANTVETDGSITFYTRSSTSSFNQLTSTLPWVANARNSNPTVNASAFFQSRADFVARSTNTVRLDDFIFNWFEGNAADKAYATYFDDKIIWSVTSGTAATTNNRELIYDTLNQTWLIWDLPSNGFYVKANKLYFGGASSGYIFKYGDVENDNGSAINSYWKSKDYFGTDPFTGQELATVSLAGKQVAGSSVTVSYTINGSSTSSFYFPLTSSKSFVGLNRNIPAGTVANNSFNLQIGNNAADQSWEIFGIQVGLRPRSWLTGGP